MEEQDEKWAYRSLAGIQLQDPTRFVCIPGCYTPVSKPYGSNNNNRSEYIDNRDFMEKATGMSLPVWTAIWSTTLN